MYYNIIHQCLKKNNKKRKYWTRKKIHLINDAFSFKINAKNWILFTTRDLNYRGNRMSSLRIIYTYDISQTQIRVHIIYSGRIYFMCSYKPFWFRAFEYHDRSRSNLLSWDTWIINVELIGRFYLCLRSLVQTFYLGAVWADLMAAHH